MTATIRQVTSCRLCSLSRLKGRKINCVVLDIIEPLTATLQLKYTVSAAILIAESMNVCWSENIYFLY